ncbi:MAG TPA: hypothetical protein VFU34_05325 [Gaiellaceae bacterium]|jgi:hypothetical protein|nr:hypothetical protein [Gaiellaceae bacterium]
MRPGSRDEEFTPHTRILDAMAVNIIGLGLIVAGIIFMIIGGVIGWIIGVICLIGGVGALFMTFQRKRRAAA